MIKVRVNTIHNGKGCVETEPTVGPISFPLVNPNRVIVPYYNALVHTLYINGFDVHKVLVDPGSVAVKLPTFRQIKLSSEMLNSVG